MKAIALLQERIIFSEAAFAELVLWRVEKPVAGSVRQFKYRLAYLVDGECVVRYNAYAFRTPEKLIADFQDDIARWNRENRNS